MKTLELDLKKKVLIIDSRDYDYFKLFYKGCGFSFNNEKYKLICKGSELTEEIASELVNSDDEYGVVMYQNYRTTSMSYFDEQITALESFISAVESKGFYWLENPISLDRAKLYESIGDTFHSKGIKKVWQEAEEKTFKNPLIFIKN